jgi:hypothetical protein
MSSFVIISRPVEISKNVIIRYHFGLAERAATSWPPPGSSEYSRFKDGRPDGIPVEICLRFHFGSQ